MAINRYSQPAAYAQFNPLSLQELSTLPLLKQGQHDQQMATALAQKAAVDALAADSAEANRFMSEVDQRISSFTEDLMNQGVNRNSARNLLNLKNYRDQLLSPQGDLGKIASNYAAYQQYAKDLKKLYDEGVIDRDTYERALSSSLRSYKGYKQGSFSGYNPSKVIDTSKLAEDYAKSIKLNKEKIAGWNYVDNYQGTGQGVWVKGERVITTPPPEVEQAIMARVLSDTAVQQNIQDQMYFMETLGMYQPDEMGNYTTNLHSYNPEAFLNNPELRRQYAQEKITADIQRKIAPAAYLARSGQEDLRSMDIKFNNAGDGSGRVVPPGGDIISDPFSPIQFGGSEDGIEGIKENIEELKGKNDSYSLQKAKRLEQHLENIEYNFKTSPQGEELFKQRNEWIVNQAKELGITKDQAAKLADAKWNTKLTDVLGNTQNLWQDEQGNVYNSREAFKNATGKEPNIRHARRSYEGIDKVFTIGEFQKYNSTLSKAKRNQPEYAEKFDDYVSAGRLSEGRIFSVGGNKLKDLNENKQALQNIISPSLYHVDGLDEAESSLTINEILGSDIVSMGHVSYGDLDMPYLRIVYKPKGSNADHPGTELMLRPKEINQSELKNSYQQGLRNLYSDKPELIRKLEDEVTYFGVNDFTDYFPSISEEYGDIKIESEPFEGSNRHYLELDGKPVTLEDFLLKFDSNGEAKIKELKKQKVDLSQIKYYNDRTQLINLLKFINYGS